MRALRFVWHHKWAALMVLALWTIWIFLGTFSVWMFVLGVCVFILGFALPIEVARVSIKDEIAADEAEEESLEETILELQKAGLIEIHPSIETEAEK